MKTLASIGLGILLTATVAYAAPDAEMQRLEQAALCQAQPYRCEKGVYQQDVAPRAFPAVSPAPRPQPPEHQDATPDIEIYLRLCSAALGQPIEGRVTMEMVATLGICGERYKAVVRGQR